MPFRQFDHDADLGLEMTSPDREGIFAEAAAGLASLLTDPSTVAVREHRRVVAEGDDVAQVLVRWLKELLFLHETEGFIGISVGDIEAGDGRVAAVVGGEKRAGGRHPLRHEVKGITYHEASFVQAEDGWRARVILDV